METLCDVQHKTNEDIRVKNNNPNLKLESKEFDNELPSSSNLVLPLLIESPEKQNESAIIVKTEINELR